MSLGLPIQDHLAYVFLRELCNHFDVFRVYVREDKNGSLL